MPTAQTGLHLGHDPIRAELCQCASLHCTTPLIIGGWSTTPTTITTTTTTSTSSASLPHERATQVHRMCCVAHLLWRHQPNQHRHTCELNPFHLRYIKLDIGGGEGIACDQSVSANPIVGLATQPNHSIHSLTHSLAHLLCDVQPHSGTTRTTTTNDHPVCPTC